MGEAEGRSGEIRSALPVFSYNVGVNIYRLFISPYTSIAFAPLTLREYVLSATKWGDIPDPKPRPPVGATHDDAYGRIDFYTKAFDEWAGKRAIAALKAKFGLSRRKAVEAKIESAEEIAKIEDLDRPILLSPGGDPIAIGEAIFSIMDDYLEGEVEIRMAIDAFFSFLGKEAGILNDEAVQEAVKSDGVHSGRNGDGDGAGARPLVGQPEVSATANQDKPAVRSGRRGKKVGLQAD